MKTFMIRVFAFRFGLIFAIYCDESADKGPRIKLINAMENQDVRDTDTAFP